MKRFLIVFCGIVCVLLMGMSPLLAAQVDVNVDGVDRPWLQSVNSSYNYGDGSGAAPTIVAYSNSGISFAAGNMITIDYLSGTTSAGPSVGFGYFDANGNTTYPVKYYSGSAWVDAPGTSGNYFPTKYSASPANTAVVYYLNALVGTFADPSGVIVGTPFFIGNDPLSIAVPTGATRLQLGINDDIFGDNAGAFVVRVSGAGPTPTPEPATMLLLGLGLLGLTGIRRKMK